MVHTLSVFDYLFSHSTFLYPYIKFNYLNKKHLDATGDERLARYKKKPANESTPKKNPTFKTPYGTSQVIMRLIDKSIDVTCEKFALITRLFFLS